MKRFYLDTSIWRDYFEDRRDSLRPLGEFAFRFLKNCGNHRCEVLYSCLVVQELRSFYSEEAIKGIFLPFINFLKEVPISGKQISEAGKISFSVQGTHIKDALHAILARDNEAVMVTRDRHFDALADFVEVAKPEDIYF